MSVKMFLKGLQNFADRLIDWNSDPLKCLLATIAADTSFRVITNATNANPSVLTSVAHGLTTGDVVVVGGVAGNLAVNQLAKAVKIDNDTFTMTTFKDGLAVQGSASYTSGGFLVNLTTATNRQDIDAGQLGTAQALTTPTLVNGVLDADDVTFTAVPDTSPKVYGAFIYQDNGSTATDRLILWHDGRIQVTVSADAASSATVLWVERLAGDLPSGTSIVFSNGKTAVLSAPATAGSRSLSVTALANAIAAGHTADVVTTGSGLPVQPNNGSILLQWAASGIAQL